MSSAARSLMVFAAYLATLGPLLITVPDILIAPFGFPEIQDVWIRVVGAIVVCLAFYYWTAAKYDLTPFIRATVQVRGSMAFVFAGFVFMEWAPPTMLIFGLVDLFGALWTHLCMRRDALEQLRRAAEK